MARGKTKRPVSSSDEGEYDTSTASAETSPVPNSRKSSKRGPPGASAPLDKENSFTEADMAPSHAPGTVRKALYMHTRTENGTPTKRRLSSRADDMRRQSFTNLRFLDTQPSNASIDSQSSSSQGHAQASGSNQLSAQPRQTMGGRIAGLAAARGRTSLGGNSGVLLGADGSPAVSRQAMNENYEEWMKMATDNKINATNTWNFALIDYFHDMSLLRNTDSDGSINFQKASCTLDGCVKIWTSRVDSTATAVGKLISGLAEEHSGLPPSNPRSSLRKLQTAAGDEEGDEGDGGGSDNEQSHQRKKRRRTAATLADDFSKIQQKHLDLEFTVDPLFRKTCADFDEGGASGILMNHLGCDKSMRVVFDAGDCRMDDGTEDDSFREGEDANLSDVTPQPLQLVDVSKLIQSHLPDISVLDDMVICPPLQHFKFSSDDSALDLDFFKQSSEREQSHVSDSEAGDAFDFAAGADGGGQEDFFADEAGGADFGNSGDGAEDFFEAGGGVGDDDEDQEAKDEQGYYVDATAQPARGQQQQDPIVALAENSGAGVFDYFDTAFSKNWAGPQHWKMRRAPPAQRKDANTSASNTSKPRKEKQPFTIDFDSPSDVKASELFAKPKARAPATVTKPSAEQLPGQHLLPDDMHFSSSSLLRLFLKPKAMINMRRRGRKGGARVMGAAQPSHGGIDQEIDENYWAQAAQDAAGGGGADFDAGADMDDPDVAPIPFSTQFLHEDEGDMMDDDVDLDVGEVGPAQVAEDDDDLLAATEGQRAKRARPEYVSFAKRAKRVDVKRLKENIWKELKIHVSEEDLEKSMQEESIVEEGPKSFTSVLDGLRQSYPKDKMDEISTSFCFICLLHLANENNLSIKPPKTEEDLAKLAMVPENDDEDVKETISNLMALEILKDRTLL